jgi:hypothetical protein
VSEFKHLETNLMNRDCFHEEIKKRLKSGNACCPSIQKLSSSRLLRRIISTNIYPNMIFSVVLRGCDITPYTPSKEMRPKIFDYKLKGKVFGPKRGKVTTD